MNDTATLSKRNDTVSRKNVYRRQAAVEDLGQRTAKYDIFASLTPGRFDVSVRYDIRTADK